MIQVCSETGSSLILAMVFLLIGTLIVTTLASWTTNDLNNTTGFRSVETNLYAADGAAEVAIASVRYTYPTTSPSGSLLSGWQYSGPCPSTNPIEVDGAWVAAWCTTSVPEAQFSRLVKIDVYADPSQTPLAIQPSESSAILVAVVGFNDAIAQSVSPPYVCSRAPSDCGNSMEVVTWRVQEQS